MRRAAPIEKLAGLCAVAIALATAAALLTHISICAKTGAWLLLFAGCFILPLGVGHGVALWFGLL